MSTMNTTKPTTSLEGQLEQWENLQGLEAEFFPEDASTLGAFQEDALTQEQAADSVFDDTGHNTTLFLKPDEHLNGSNIPTILTPDLSGDKITGFFDPSKD